MTLCKTKSDNNNQMITVPDEIYLLIFSNWDIEMWSQ